MLLKENKFEKITKGLSLCFMHIKDNDLENMKNIAIETLDLIEELEQDDLNVGKSHIQDIMTKFNLSKEEAEKKIFNAIRSSLYEGIESALRLATFIFTESLEDRVREALGEIKK